MNDLDGVARGGLCDIAALLIAEPRRGHEARILSAIDQHPDPPRDGDFGYFDGDGDGWAHRRSLRATRRVSRCARGGIRAQRRRRSGGSTLAGILDRFRRRRAMTVVFEIAPADGRLPRPTTDLLRMAEFIETLPGLEPMHVTVEIHRSRDGALEDVAYSWRRKGDLLPEPGTGLEEAHAASDPFADITCISDLVRSTRAMEAVIRACVDLWERLRGEVDVDGLVVSMAITRCTQRDSCAGRSSGCADLREVGCRARRPGRAGADGLRGPPKVCCGLHPMGWGDVATADYGRVCGGGSSPTRGCLRGIPAGPDECGRRRLE